MLCWCLDWEVWACEATAAARLGSECNDWPWCWRDDKLPDEAEVMAIVSANSGVVILKDEQLQ